MACVKTMLQSHTCQGSTNHLHLENAATAIRKCKSVQFCGDSNNEMRE